MSECQESDRHPTEILAEDIKKFASEIDSLYTTLPLLMKIMTTLVQDTQQKFKTFLNDHALNKTESDHQFSYAIKVDDIGKHDRLKRQRNNTSIAARFIPRHFITSLLSQYDCFLGNVVRFIYEAKPETLNACEKSIPFVELQKFDTIQAAREYIIEKEVETVIRKSPAEQFSWLKEKLGVPFNKDLKVWPVFVELNERRNLFVHCDGRVSSQYLRCCSEHKCEIDPNLGIGDQLEVNPDYFKEAYKCVYEIGVKIAHVVWRKLCPIYVDGSDDNIIDLTYELIDNKQYDLAIRLLEFFTEPVFKHSKDYSKRIMIINLAQAHKWAGNDKTCAKVLDGIDWSATEDRFKLAVAVLYEDFDLAYELIQRLKHDKSFLKAYYRDWPLFKQLRKQDKFLHVFQECYGEPFKVQKMTEERSVEPPAKLDRQETEPASR
jgi:hypothetical protein